MSKKVQILKDKFINSVGLPFKDLLPETLITEILSELGHKYKSRLFDPIVTLWAFLSQVLDVDKSCHNAVSRVIAYLVGEGVELPSTRKACILSSTNKVARKITRKVVLSYRI